MHIEWNRVTWYSTVTAVAVFVGVFFLGIYLGTQFNAPVVEQSSSSVASSASTSTASAKSPASNVVKKGLAALKYAAIVNMTSSGFVPKNVQIKAGQSVHFVNMTSASMRIFSDTFQKNQPYYTGFDELHSVGKNGTYDFLFNDPGVWTYYNLNGNPQLTGTITVE